MEEAELKSVAPAVRLGCARVTFAKLNIMRFAPGCSGSSCSDTRPGIEEVRFRHLGRTAAEECGSLFGKNLDNFNFISIRRLPWTKQK